jgi:hypothetical protein
MMQNNQDMMEANQENMMEKLDVYHERTFARLDCLLEKMEAGVESNHEEMNATDLESNPKEIEAMMEHQEVPKEGTAAENLGALEDPYGDCHLAVGRRQKQKKQTQNDGGFRKKLAAARGQFLLA